MVKMSKHTYHQMQLTSLYCKFPRYNETQYNEKFRNRMEIEILNIHQNLPQGLTDEELGDILKVKLRQPNLDTDVYRPRRSDLSKERKGKAGNLLRPSFLMDSGKKRPNRFGRPCIVWVLNPDNLVSYMGGDL